MCFELADFPVPDQYGRCPPGYYATADWAGPYCARYRRVGDSWAWGGVGVGFNSTDYRVTTLNQRTFNVLDLLSPDTSAGLGSTNFRGDISFGWDTALGNWPNYPNAGWGPMTLGIQATFGYSDSDKKVNRIPGEGFFLPNGPGSDFVRLETSWTGSVGPRLGIFTPPGTFAPGTFFYVNGGAAFQEFKATVNCGTGLCEPNGIPQVNLSVSKWLTGYYFGGGFMTPLTRHLRFGVEVRETDYGDWTTTLGNPALYQGTFKFDRLREFSAMARVNYNWDTTRVMSDARVKRDIERVERREDGLNLYRYRYLWSDQIYVGVMAQEVALSRGDAVEHGADGYLRVNYDRLGLRLQTWDEWAAAHPQGG